MTNTSTSTILKALREIMEARIRDINTAQPAVIESYDPDTHLASVVVPIVDYIEADDVEPVEQEWPQVDDVIVLFPGGGGFDDMFPLQKGDPGLLIFCQRDITEWFLSDGSEPVTPADLQPHNESSAFFIPKAVTNKTIDNKGHSKNWIQAHKSGKFKRIVEPGGKVTYVAPKMEIGAEGAAIAAAKSDVVNSRLDALETKVNLILSTALAAGGLILPPLPPLIPGSSTASDKLFVSS